jgi:hypothetical protein
MNKLKVRFALRSILKWPAMYTYRDRERESVCVCDIEGEGETERKRGSDN